jgi:hypothetical protein
MTRCLKESAPAEFTDKQHTKSKINQAAESKAVVSGYKIGML